MIEFLGRNWGNLASVVGLVFSILAFVFSKRASKAAREARELVLSRSLGEDMNAGNRTATEMVTYVTMGKGEMALLRAGELMNHTSYIIARWQDRLPEVSKNNLLDGREQLRSIQDLLTRTPVADLAARERTRLTRSCQQVNAIFSEEYGAALRAAEHREV